MIHVLTSAVPTRAVFHQLAAQGLVATATPVRGFHDGGVAQPWREEQREKPREREEQRERGTKGERGTRDSERKEHERERERNKRERNRGRNKEREEQREKQRERERYKREKETRERGTRERGTAAREQAKTIGETSNISAFDPSITQVYPKYHPSIPPSTPHMHIPRPPCTTSASDAVSVASQKAQVLQKKEKKRRASEPPSISLCHFHRTHFLANITSKRGEGKQPLKTTTILTKTPHLEFQQPRL